MRKSFCALLWAYVSDVCRFLVFHRVYTNIDAVRNIIPLGLIPTLRDRRFNAIMRPMRIAGDLQRLRQVGSAFYRKHFNAAPTQCRCSETETAHYQRIYSSDLTRSLWDGICHNDIPWFDYRNRQSNSLRCVNNRNGTFAPTKFFSPDLAEAITLGDFTTTGALILPGKNSRGMFRLSSTPAWNLSQRPVRRRRSNDSPVSPVERTGLS